MIRPTRESALDPLVFVFLLSDMFQMKVDWRADVDCVEARMTQQKSLLGIARHPVLLAESLDVADVHQRR